MIKLKELDFRYNNNNSVLKQIDLDFNMGSIYGLLGKNGEGKTTLLKIISGLIFPCNGCCSVLSEIPSKRKLEFLNSIFFLPENHILPDIRVRDFLKIYSVFYNSYSYEIQKKCIEYFNLDTSAFIHQMSEGQKKKVSITMAISANTPILLMDEPTNALDVPSKYSFRKLIAMFSSDDKLIIIATHQVRELENLIDSIVILDNRSVLINKTLQEIGDKLCYKKIEIDDAPLYSDISVSGQFGIVENLTGYNSLIPLEAIFNMAITQKEKIKKIFNN